MSNGSKHKLKMLKEKQRVTRQDCEKIAIVKRKGINYNYFFALIDKIKGKLQENEDVQVHQLIFEKSYEFGSRFTNTNIVWKNAIDIEYNGKTTFLDF